MQVSGENNALLVEQFYQAALCPELWQDTLTSLAKATGCRGALLPTSVFVPGCLTHSHGMGDVLSQFFEEGWHEMDLRTQAARTKRTISGFVSDYDLFSAEDILNSDYYEGFARDAGVPWFAAALLTDTFEDGYVALSLQRCDNDGPFEAEEIGRLNALLPHLRSASRFAVKLAGTRAKVMIEGLTAGGQAALMIDAKGQVLHINDLCRQLLDNGLSIRHKHLRAENAQQDAQLAHLIQWACDGGRQAAMLPHPSVAIRSSNAAHSLVVSAAPVHRTAADLFGFQGAILRLTPLARNIIVSETMLESLFELTRREAQIMSLVGSGGTVDDIAGRLSISREAVRFHLKGIFAKTGSHRQSDIVALCGNLATKSGR